MPKKRKTRQQKKILKLKRELERVKGQRLQTAKAKKPQQTPLRAKASRKPVKKTERNFQSEYDENLIKKDLLKTLFLSLLFFAGILVFYLYSETKILPSFKINFSLTKILEPFLRISFTKSQ